MRAGACAARHIRQLRHHRRDIRWTIVSMMHSTTTSPQLQKYSPCQICKNIASIKKLSGTPLTSLPTAFILCGRRLNRRGGKCESCCSSAPLVHLSRPHSYCVPGLLHGEPVIFTNNIFFRSVARHSARIHDNALVMRLNRRPLVPRLHSPPTDDTLRVTSRKNNPQDSNCVTVTCRAPTTTSSSSCERPAPPLPPVAAPLRRRRRWNFGSRGRERSSSSYR